MDQGVQGALGNIQQDVETQNVCMASILNVPGHSDTFVCQSRTLWMGVEIMTGQWTQSRIRRWYVNFI